MEREAEKKTIDLNGSVTMLELPQKNVAGNMYSYRVMAVVLLSGHVYWERFLSKRQTQRPTVTSSQIKILVQNLQVLNKVLRVNV